MKRITTKSSNETKGAGKALAEIIIAGKNPNLKRFGLFELLRAREAKPLIIALEGDLGSGKTTFTQGLLRGLDAKGPYTSPTFVIMKKYKNNIYHFDAYRANDKAILNLGWEEIVADPKNIIIIEWADRIKKIIPKTALWIRFEWLDKNKRKITMSR